VWGGGQRLVLPPHTTRLPAAQEIARLNYTDKHGRLLLRWHRGDYYRRLATHWQKHSQSGMGSDLYRITGNATFTEPEDETEEETGEKKPQPWNPNKIRIANLSEALALGVVHLDEDVEPGTWIEGGREGHLIPVRNGLLDRDTRELHPHSPDYFGIWSLPYDYNPDYNPDASPPEALLGFLNEICQGDQQMMSRIQEWTGYLLSGDTRLQKIGLLLGPPRAGKGTLMTMWEDLLGPANCVSPTLFSLSGRFGPEQLIGKQLAQFKDENFKGRSTDLAVAVTVLKTISGAGDSTVSVERKGKVTWTGVPTVRMNISANDFSGLNDASVALATRFYIFVFTITHVDSEDETLSDRLRGELPSILNWALDGWDRLRARGRLIETEETLAERATISSAGSEYKRFVDECLEIGPEYSVSREAVWEIWKLWCLEEGIKPGIRNTLGQSLRSVVPSIGKSQPRMGGKKVWFHTGIRIAEDVPSALRLIQGGVTVSADTGAKTPGTAS